MKFILATITFFLFTSNGVAQKTYQFKGRIVDSINQPITNAHIKILGSDTGVITNQDGVFHLTTTECNPKLNITHINYKHLEVPLDCTNQKSKTIILESAIYQLNEVNVVALTAKEIINRCIQNLDMNHGQSSVTYRVFNRVVEHTNYKPIRITEYLFDMGPDFNNKCIFKPIKIRGKAYSDKGAKTLEDLRLIELHSNESYVLLRFVPNFLKKIKKKYSYSLQGLKQDSAKEYYVIHIFLDKYIQNAVLHIETKSYAISYLKYFYEDEKYHKMSITNSVKESFFEEINDKWYFKHGKKSELIINNNDLPISYESITTVVKREKKLNFSKAEDFGNMAQKLQDFQGEFEDSFWETNNYIPLPNWLKEQIN